VVGVWNPILVFKHGEPPNSIKKSPQKKEIDRKVIRRKKKKVMHVKA